MYNDQRRWEWFWIMLLMLCNSLLIVSWSCFVVLLWYHHHFITALLVFPEYWDYLLLMLCCGEEINWLVTCCYELEWGVWIITVLATLHKCQFSGHQHQSRSGKILQSICSGFESNLIHLLNSRFIIRSAHQSLACLIIWINTFSLSIDWDLQNTCEAHTGS